MRRLALTLAILVLVAHVCCGFCNGQLRIWTDSTGRHTTDAEFVEFKDGMVTLRKPDGNTVSLPIERLTEKDQEYVRKAASNRSLDQEALERFRQATDLLWVNQPVKALSIVENHTSPLDKAMTACIIYKDRPVQAFQQYSPETAAKLVAEVWPWLEEHANVPDIAVVMGLFLHKGIGVEKNLERAIQLFINAADQGSPQALYSLGYCYLNGQGVDKDEEKGAALLRQAASKGNPNAMLLVAKCYEDGRGVKRNQKAALGWLEQAARRGHTFAMVRCALKEYEVGSGANGQVRKEHYQNAARWASRSAEAGNLWGQFVLGAFTGEGVGVQRDAERGIELITCAATAGLPEAILELARMYRKGDGVTVDKRKARELALKAVEQAKSQESPTAEKEASELAQRWSEIDAATLIVESWHWEADARIGLVTVEGLVTNNSRQPLENVEVVATFRTSERQLVTSETSLIEYNPILAGQTSPFKVIVRYNPAINACSVGFKNLAGVSIDYASEEE